MCGQHQKAEHENIWHQENNGCSPGASIPKDVEKPWLTGWPRNMIYKWCVSTVFFPVCRMLTDHSMLPWLGFIVLKRVDCDFLPYILDMVYPFIPRKSWEKLWFQHFFLWFSSSQNHPLFPRRSRNAVAAEVHGEKSRAEDKAEEVGSIAKAHRKFGRDGHLVHFCTFEISSY
jgi:hypothetical protein